MYTFISNSLQTWASFYANHGGVRTLISFLHIAGLMVAGGFALAADRASLKAAKQVDQRDAQLHFVRKTHMPVVAGLVVVTISGTLLFAADTDTFLHSNYFWIKLSLFAVLLINGAFLTRAERLATKGQSKGWRQLQWTSGFSIALWLLTTLAGAALQNVG